MLKLRAEGWRRKWMDGWMEYYQQKPHRRCERQRTVVEQNFFGI